MKRGVVFLSVMIAVASVTAIRAQDQSLGEFRRSHDLSLEAKNNPGFVSIRAELLVNRGDGWSTLGNSMWLIWTAGGDRTCVGTGCRPNLSPGVHVVLNLNTNILNLPRLRADTYSIADWNRMYPPEKFRIRPYAETSSVYKPDHYQDLSETEQTIIQQKFCLQGLSLYDHLIEDTQNFFHYDPRQMINICAQTSRSDHQLGTQEIQVPAVAFLAQGARPLFIADTSQKVAVNDAHGMNVCQSNGGFCPVTLSATDLDHGMTARGMKVALFVTSDDDEDADQKQYGMLTPEKKAVVQTICSRGITVYERLYGELSPDGRAISYAPANLRSVCQSVAAAR
jgi:hypothetical protein